MTHLVLIAGYVAILALLVNLGLRSDWKWQVKLFVVLLTLAFYVGTWFGLKWLQGWPIAEQLPDEFRLLSRMVIQPNKQTGEQGAIYVWVEDLTRPDVKEPRAYRLPYIEQLHEEIEEAHAGGKPKVGRRVGNIPSSPSDRTDSGGNNFLQFDSEPKRRPPRKK